MSRRIIPCLDVRDGHVVKGVRFRDHVDMGAIEALALRYRNEGADELVFYDIGASPEMRSVNVAWVQRVSDLLDIPFCVAGGIADVETARRVLHAGADKISVNSPAFIAKSEGFGASLASGAASHATLPLPPSLLMRKRSLVPAGSFPAANPRNGSLPAAVRWRMPSLTAASH